MRIRLLIIAILLLCGMLIACQPLGSKTNKNHKPDPVAISINTGNGEQRLSPDHRTGEEREAVKEAGIGQEQEALKMIEDEQVLNHGAQQSEASTILACEPLSVAATDNLRFVRVSVATLWKEPGKGRAMDEPSMAVPARPAMWTQSMTIPDKLWFVGKTETQALYGQAVELLDRQGDWVKVAIKDQHTPANNSGYPGWMPEAQLTGNREFPSYEHCPFLVVKSKKTSLYEHQGDSQPWMEISFNTRLPAVEVTAEWVQAVTPDGKKVWISSDEVNIYNSISDIPKPSGTELVETAKQFLDLPYLWAGTSAYGFDCSGFTYSIYRYHGIDIPRDSKDQAVHGDKVEPDDLKPGDLLFYAYNEGKGNVHHVAMYIGDGRMIHSPRTERSVEIIPMSTPAYAVEFAGARRYIQ